MVDMMPGRAATRRRRGKRPRRRVGWLCAGVAGERRGGCRWSGNAGWIFLAEVLRFALTEVLRFARAEVARAARWAGACFSGLTGA